LNHFATPKFWFHYRALPADIQQLADRCFEFMKTDPRHPSIHLKQVSDYWSARVGLHYRALGTSVDDGISWFWVGSHADYDKLVA
jgi:hypothetical protein